MLTGPRALAMILTIVYGLVFTVIPAETYVLYGLLGLVLVIAAWVIAYRDAHPGA